MITVAIGQSYDGPLDVLLALVRREGYPMDRLPVSEITRQYRAYLEDARKKGAIDVDEGAEFFETASWLVLLKSRALLPKAAGELYGEAAPEQELARALLDHEALRAAARGLRERLDGAGLAPGIKTGHDAGPSAGSAQEIEPAPATLPEGREEAAAPTVQDVLVAARRALEQARAHAQGTTLAAADAYPVETLSRGLEERLAALEPGRGISTEAWFTALPDGRHCCINSKSALQHTTCRGLRFCDSQLVVVLKVNATEPRRSILLVVLLLGKHRSG